MGITRPGIPLDKTLGDLNQMKSAGVNSVMIDVWKDVDRVTAGVSGSAWLAVVQGRLRGKELSKKAVAQGLIVEVKTHRVLEDDLFIDRFVFIRQFDAGALQGVVDLLGAGEEIRGSLDCPPPGRSDERACQLPIRRQERDDAARRARAAAVG